MTILTGVVSYPIPAYSNVPIEAQFYEPSVFDISAVTLGFNTTITTSVNHNYVVGQQVRLLIPPQDGCMILNGLTGYVLSIPGANQVVISINSNGANAFTNTSTQQLAQIVAIGDVNQGYTNASGPLSQTPSVPGSFINISPL